MCQICGYSPCSHDVQYTYNWYNIDNQPCTTCGTTTVCKKRMPAKCSIYNGTMLTTINVSAGIDIETILSDFDVVIANIQANNIVQTTKNNNIQTALNDINARLNALEGGTPHADYVI